MESPVAREHDNDQIWQISNIIELESVFTSLIHPLSAGNETGQEQLVTSTIQVTGMFPWEASLLQQYIASITEHNNAEQNAFQPIVNHFLALSTTTLGFQYTLKQCKPIKDHGQCYYFVCNLSESTKNHHKDHNNPAHQRKQFINPRKCYSCSGSLSISIHLLCSDTLDVDGEQPVVTLKYQHKHIYRPPIDNRIAPEIVQFIEEYKLNVPAEIEWMLKRDARFDSKMDNITTQQIYNH